MPEPFRDDLDRLPAAGSRVTWLCRSRAADDRQIALVLGAGWMVVRPKVIENIGDRIKAVWSKDGPT